VLPFQIQGEENKSATQGCGPAWRLIFGIPQSAPCFARSNCATFLHTHTFAVNGPFSRPLPHSITTHPGPSVWWTDARTRHTLFAGFRLGMCSRPDHPTC